MGIKSIYANESNPKAGAGRTLIFDLDDGTPKIIHAIDFRGIGYTNTNTELDLSTVISQVRLLQDTQEKAIFIPSLQRKLDDFMNANADTLKISHMRVPFNRFLDPGRGWGNRNYGKLLLEVKMVSGYPANTDCSDIKALIHYTDVGEKLNRGNVYVQTVLPQPAPVAGWNQINDLQYYGISDITKILFDNPAITEVEIYRGTELRYQKQKADALFELQQNPLFKVPSTCTHLEVAGQAVASTGPFPAMIDQFAQPGSAFPLFIGGERQQIKVRYKWDTTVNAVAAFNILVEGIENDVQKQGTSAIARA